MFNTVVDFKSELMKEQLQVFSGEIYLVALHEEHYWGQTEHSCPSFKAQNLPFHIKQLQCGIANLKKGQRA